MKKNLSLKEIILVASLLFGMLFGAGNLIFPVHMGQLAGENSMLAAIGFNITAVGFPVLGIIAIALTRTNDMYELSALVGDKYKLPFTIALYLTIGPLFAIPRCATTAYTIGFTGIISPKFSQTGLLIYSIIFFALVLLFAIKPSKILDYIGKYINPLFLIFFIFLLIYALINPSISIAEITAEGEYSTIPIFKGMVDGYQTMDAIATLAFGIVIIEVIKELGVKDVNDIARNTIKSGIIAAILMTIIYFMTTIMGAESRGLFSISDNGGTALSQISTYYFENVGSYLLLVIVSLACFKTSLGLITSISQMFQKLFPHFISEKKWAVIFTLASFIISNFGLNAIISYSLPVLMFLYPLTISLVLIAILGHFFKFSKPVYVFSTIFCIVPAFFDFIYALPSHIIDSLNLQMIINVGKHLPLFDIGMGWVIPTFIGLILGLIYQHNFVEDEPTITY